jgi:ParB family transcriptional regulator, chromosome partitioning protein
MRRRQIRSPSVYGDDRQTPGLDLNRSRAVSPRNNDRRSRSGPACRAILPVLWRDPEEPEDENVRDRLWQIQERIEELSEGEATWPDAAKANAGALVGIGHSGELDVLRGLIRPEDKAAARKAGKAGKAKATRQKGRGPSPLRRPREELTAHRTAALQAMLADNPKIALVATVHALALDCLYAPVCRSPVKVKTSITDLRGSAEGIDDSAACKLFAATTKRVTKGMPKQPEKLWAWLMDQDQKTLLAILAVCAASTVEALWRGG